MAAFACLLSGGEGYTYVPIARLAREPAGSLPERIITSGVYLPDGEYEWLVRGVLADQGAQVRVLGSVFDWRPPARARIDVWGRMRHDASGPYFEFWNGRLHQDTSRGPRPTPAVAPGQPLTLVVRLRFVGADPFPYWIAETEDRVVFFVESLPGRPPSGIVARIRAEVLRGGPTGGAVRITNWEPVPWAPPPPPGG